MTVTHTSADSITWEVRQHDDRFTINPEGAGTQAAGMVTYVDRNGRRIFVHTEVDPEHQGEGLAAMLVRQALDVTRADGIIVVPLCPYVQEYITQHSEYSDLAEPPSREDLESVQAVHPGA